MLMNTTSVLSALTISSILLLAIRIQLPFSISLLLQPLKLFIYNDASILCMNYAEYGTIINIIKILQQCTRPGGSLTMSSSSSEYHELICAYCSLQMLQAIQLLHNHHIIHTDIKTDNWVIKKVPPPSSSSSSSSSSLPSFRLCLIDFGRARDMLMPTEVTTTTTTITTTTITTTTATTTITTTTTTTTAATTTTTTTTTSTTNTTTTTSILTCLILSLYPVLILLVILNLPVR